MKPLPIILAAVAGMAVGFFAGRQSSAPAAVAVTGPFGSQGRAATTQEPASLGGAAGSPSQSSTGEVMPLTFEILTAELARLEMDPPSSAAAWRARAELQDRLKISDLPALVARLADAPVADRGLGLIFRAYAEENPQQAWNLALAMQQPGSRRNALSAVISAWASTNAEQALAMTQAIKEADLRRQLRSIALQNLAAKDPARAFSLATRSTEDTDFNVTSVMAQWMRKDPEAAKAAAATLSGRQAEMARMAIISELARQDPRKAWDFASRLPQITGDGAWMDPRFQVITQWAQSDPAAAVGAALAIQDTEKRNQIVASAVSAWASSDFEAALGYAVQIPDADTRGRILQNLASTQSADRSRMFDVLMEHAPSGDSFRNAMTSLVHQWARENPREAAMAVKQLPANRSFSHLAGSVAEAWMASGADKMEVFNWARSLPEGQARTSTVNSLFDAWARDDSAGALRLLSSLGGDERTEAMLGIANGWSRTAPSAAAQWVASLPPGGERDNALRGVMSRWIQASPAEVIAFLGKIPDGERVAVMGPVVSNWASRDAASAATWVQRQPAGRAKDEALKALSRQIFLEDPEAALAWAVAISDPEGRTSQTERLAREWRLLDPASARKWITTSPLAPEVRERLLK